MDILKVKPLTDYGSALEIGNGFFGGNKEYVAAELGKNEKQINKI